MSSQGYHLPSRVMKSPPRAIHRTPPQQVEMTELKESHNASSYLSPDVAMHTSPSLNSLRSPQVIRPRSPQPLNLPSSNQTLHQINPHIVPFSDSIVERRGSDPFEDTKIPLDSPNALPSSFDTTPPVSPADSTTKKKKENAGPPPLYKPTLGLLFSLSTREDKLTLLLPACLLSLASGIIPPYMTFVLGDAFDAFAAFQQAIMAEVPDLPAAKHDLRADMLIVAVKLIALGVGAVTTSTASLALWVWHGERVAERLRRQVYLGVSSKPLAWFDTGMGKKGAGVEGGFEGEDENESSGGLMGRFARETDDVRMALSSTAGRILTSLCTGIACLVVAFWHSYQLTFVILGAAPVILLVIIAIEVIVTPKVMVERHLSASAAGRVERTTGAITTVKAFNAEQSEINEFNSIIARARKTYNTITLLWGLRAGAVQVLLLSMFVTGFWFGNYLVSSGKKSAGEVTLVFWAALLASSNMQAALPQLNILDKAKVAMAALLETIHESDTHAKAARPASDVESDSKSPLITKSPLDSVREFSSPPLSPTVPTLIPIKEAQEQAKAVGKSKRHRRQGSRPGNTMRGMRKIHPTKFSGELVLKNVTFHYPSRPHPAAPALKNVSLYLPACETTYIVGGSGSGKSTVGSLLLGLYQIDSGRIEADEQGIEWLDEAWLRGHVSCVSQGASVIFEGTVHENVALGIVGAVGTKQRKPEDVSREEVIQACRAALFHDFVRELPDGYDTMLSGEKGASLSGGQRQRLAIARAYIRDPTVLILDEATSALDATSRLLVNEAAKRWRKGKTTIIITHDLSPIDSNDFVYVMKDGEVVEQGYREELESIDGGWFRHLHQIQATAAGASEGGTELSPPAIVEDLAVPDVLVTPPMPSLNRFNSHLSTSSNLFVPGVGLGESFSEHRRLQRVSRNFVEEQEQRRLRTPSPVPGTKPLPLYTPPRSDSLSVPSLPCFDRQASSESVKAGYKRRSNRDSGMSMLALERVGLATSAKRPAPGGRRAVVDTPKLDELVEVKTAGEAVEGEGTPAQSQDQAMPSIFQIFKILLPQVPNKVGLIFGFALCILSGVCTPLFSNLFAQLMAALSAPGSVNTLKTALFLIGIAVVDGCAQWGKYSILQNVAMGWVHKLQQEAFGSIIVQDKAWFDQTENSPVRLVSNLVKDAEDARNLIGYVAGNFVVIASMILLGVIWAFVAGWQLTLVGLALGPIFVLSTMASNSILGRYERLNKAEREECARKFHQTVSNIRAIRSMSLEPVFLEKFEKSTRVAYYGGRRSAFFTGFGSGIGFFTVYLAQAVMFYVGAIFIAQGLYTFAQMLRVFVLLIFAVTFSGQILQNVPQVAKAHFAAVELLRLHRLSRETAESQGKLTFPVLGNVSFESVTFAYPSRPDVTVLDNVSFQIRSGECVAIVGPSGSGKSTVAALLQRLYEPAYGGVRVDGRPLARIDVRYLRDHVAVVSQHPALFDMSVADNISYGIEKATLDDVIRAARLANVHDFIMSLPDGYRTHLGENAALISGGQAQRLQIARALLRPKELLIGDEITSALDAENQEAVMHTINDVKKGRTTILVTHKLSVMKSCDRIIVMENGRVVQQGTFDELMSRHGGPFASLASGGEWGQ